MSPARATPAGRDPGPAPSQFIALLRGVNVAGRSVPMAQLRDLVARLGHADVRTYIQSGNVLFWSSGDDPAQLASELRAAIGAEVGHAVTVLIRTPAELAAAIATNPFAMRGETSPLHVTFLERVPDAAACARLAGDPGTPDEFVRIGREIYLWCPNGYGRTALSNDFFERRLGVAATTRNWRTVTRLAALAAA
jgi:uncharacterized protein (DUF1697 family)